MRSVDIERSAQLDIHTISEQGIERFGTRQARLYLDEQDKQFELLAEQLCDF